MRLLSLSPQARPSRALHGRLSLVFTLSLCCLLVACGGSSSDAKAPKKSAAALDEPANPPVAETVEMPLTQLERAEVEQAVSNGLGVFLQEVEVEPSLVDERFEGFRIVRFTHPQKWRGVGLLPGDVILSINEMPIERPEQAFAAFAQLKTAEALEVDYLREGKKMRLTLPIVGEPSPAEPPAEAGPEAPEAPSDEAAED